MITPEQTIALKWTLYSIAFMFVAMRIYVRWWLQCHFTLPDIAIILALAMNTVEEVLSTLAWKKGYYSTPADKFTVGGFPDLGQEEEREELSYLLALLFFSTLLTFLVFWVIKVAFLLLYYQFVSKSMVKLRWTLHFLSALVGLTFIPFIYLCVFSCPGGDVSLNWTTDPGKFCFSFDSFQSFVYVLVAHLLTDFLIYIFPFFLLQYLHLSRKEVVGVASMFALGLLCVTCTIARSATVWATGQIPIKALTVWDSGEMALGTVVACSPCLRWLWKSFKHYPNGAQPDLENDTEAITATDMNDSEKKSERSASDASANTVATEVEMRDVGNVHNQFG